LEEIPLSHIVTLTTEIKDPVAIQAACRRLGLAQSVLGKTSLFSGEVEGWAVQLPNWQYPLVCDIAKGTLHYDNFAGRWGEERYLDRFLQAYAVEKAKLEAARQGHSVRENQLADGSIKLTIQVQGGAA
jgi:hypothetical protein